MDQAQFLSLNETLNFEVVPFWDGQPDDFGVHFSSETELGPDQTMTVKVSVYDEGKAEGGESYYEVKDGMVRAIGNSGSGPWGIPPGPQAVELPLADFAAEIKKEADGWKEYWIKQGADQ